MGLRLLYPPAAVSYLLLAAPSGLRLSHNAGWVPIARRRAWRARQPLDVVRTRQRDRVLNEETSGLDRAQCDGLVGVFASMDGPIAGIGELVDDPVPPIPPTAPLR